jgi:hypothetical protein
MQKKHGVFVMIEEQLERIAVASERIAIALESLTQPNARKPVIPAAPSDDVVPGGEDANPRPTDLGVTDSKQLRVFTQRALDAAEKEAKAAAPTDPRAQLVNALVTFIKGEVCAKFSPTEPKLVKIPDKDAAVAAGMIYAWTVKNRINLGV